MMSNSTHFRPKFDLHGLKYCHNSLNIVNQAHFQPQFFQNTYPNNNGLPISPILQTNNPHINCHVNFSLKHKHESVKIPNTIISEVPIMPRDPEMLKNIDLLSSSVVKEGLTIEKMTQEKELNNPKFGFLFESELGTEAAIGKKYYEWKKNALQATFHPQHQSQALPFLSNHCCSSQIQVPQKETFDSLDEDFFSSRGIDMEIEDDYGESSTIYIEESKKIEKLGNESPETISNTLNNYKINNETSRELSTINKVEDTLIAKEDMIELNEENNLHSNNYQNINGLHQTIDDNKIEDNQKVTSRCCNETLQQLVYIERNNASIEIPLEKSFEIEDKNIESYEKINVSEKDVGQNSNFKLKNNDALEMDSIETENFLNEENFLEITKSKSKDSSSYVNEEEDHCCFNLHESSEVVVNMSLVSPTSNTIKQRSINAMENFKSKDFVSPIDVEENYCIQRPEIPNEIVENRHVESRSIDINSQVDMDAIKSLVVSKNPISSNVTTFKSNQIILDEYGRIIQNGGNYSSDVEDRHLTNLRKNTSEDSLKIHEQTIINQNHKIQSTNRSLSPEKKQRRLQRYGTKWDILPSKNVNYEKETCKNYGHDYENVNDDNNVKKKRFGKCKFYARGHCRRGHHCWFEHSTSKIDERYDKQSNEGSNKNLKHKSWQAVPNEYSSGNTSSSSNIKKQDERSEHSLSLNKKIDYNEIQSKAFDDYNYKESEIYLENNKFVNKYYESDSPTYKMKQNKRFKYDVSLDKNIDYNKVQSKAFDDNNYEESKTYLEENNFINKSHERDSSNYSINSEKELNLHEGKNKQESWQENVEENSDSCNGCSNKQGKDSKEFQEEKQKTFEKNIDNSEGLSNYSDCKKCKIYSKHDEIQIKPTEDIEDTKDLDYKLQKNKSLLLDTTTSSDHPSAVSSTASLDHIPGESSVISPPIQTLTKPQVSQLPNIETLSTETSIIPKISQISNFTTPIKTSIALQDPQISNQISPMQSPMLLQPPQISNLTMPHGNNQREILSSTPLATIFGNIPNSTSLNAFAPKQTPMQTNMSLLPSSTNPSAVYSPSPWYNPPYFGSRNINVLPPIQYSKVCTPIPQNFRIQQDNIMQPSNVQQTTSTIQRNDQFLLPSLSNSQNILQNIKYPLLQSDYNPRLQHPIQPYNYVQSSMLNKLPQQNQYIINSTPQNTYSSELQQDLQPSFRGPSSSNVMQFVNQRFPTPTPNLKYNSLLTPSTMAYSIRPTEASILQQNYMVPPPPPPRLESMLSTKYNTFDSYPSTQIYSSLHKPYIGSETLINKKYEFTNSHPTTITTLPSLELQNPKHDILQPYTIATPTFENVSPIGEGGQSWTETKGDKSIEGTTKKASDHKQKKKCQPKVRGLTLLRKNIGGYAKELLKPKWQEGIMTKEAFKTIVKKTVDKVTRSIKSDHVPNNEEKVTSYMNSARPKILKLVQGYLGKYVKD